MNLQYPPPPSKDQTDLRNYKPVPKGFISPGLKTMMEGMPPAKAYKAAASNFYTIAGLSLVNSIIAAFGSGIIFVIGLGITQLVDAIASVIGKNAGDSKLIFTIMALVFDLMACSVIAGLGYFTSKGHMWALLTGVVLYVLDTLLMLFFKVWVGFFFHLFFLWQIWTAYRVLRGWQKLQAQHPVDGFPQNIGTS